MKNLKTTMAGFFFGLPVFFDALYQAYIDGYFTDKSGWQLVLSLAFVVLMVIVKDPKKKKTTFLSINGDGKVTPDKAPLS